MPPPSISSTLLAGYDASTLGLANNDPVGTWPDMSGNGFDLLDQGGDPVYVLPALNGMGGVHFDTNSDRRRVTGMTSHTNATFFIVAINPADGGGIVKAFNDQTLSKPFFAKWTENGRWIWGTSDVNFIEFTDVSLVDQPCLWTGTIQATGAILRANQVQRVSGNLSGVAATTSLEIGTSLGDPDWTVCEYLVYDGVVSAADIRAIEAYLFEKWRSPLQDGFPFLVSQMGIPFTSDTTDHQVPMPEEEVAAGDLLMVFFNNDGGDDVTTPGDGWNLLETVDTTNLNSNWYWKEAEGDESGTTVNFVTAGVESAVAHVLHITNWDPAVPPEAEGANLVGTGSDCPALTPSWGSAKNLWIVGLGRDSTEPHPSVSVPPTNYDLLLWTPSTTSAGSGGSCEAAIASRLLEASADDPGSFTIDASANQRSSFTVAIKGASPASQALTGAVFANPPIFVAGTISQPSVPGGSEGNRIGGTGAIRRSPNA